MSFFYHLYINDYVKIIAFLTPLKTLLDDISKSIFKMAILYLFQVIEQLCAPSTSRAEVNCEEMSMKIPEFSEPLTKEIGVQCCFGYRYDVTATASTQTEPPPTQQSTDADTPKVADPSPSSNNRNEILHDHSYSSS